MFERLGKGNLQFDLVMCLGFFYYTIRHAELLEQIEPTGAGLVVIDTEVTPAVDQVPVAPTADPRIVCSSACIVQLLLAPWTTNRWHGVIR